VKAGPVRWALRLYPRWWRERYGAELHDLADELVDAGATTASRAAAGLVVPAALERSRALRRAGAKLALVGLALIVVAGISLAVVAGSRSHPPSAVASKATATTELRVFIEPVASTQEITALGRVIAGMEPGQLKSCRYVDKRQAFAEFKKQFRSEPDMVAAMTPAKMPPSFRCVPATAVDLASLAGALEQQPEILNVVYRPR
jgi:cell division protein FtsX